MSMAMDATEVSRHKCLIYDGHPAEQLPVIVPLLMEGLSANQRCLYLGDPATIAMVRGALESRGVDVAQAVERGSLVLSADRPVDGGSFDPQAMVGMLTDLIDEALRDGYAGLYATGDMRWELGSDQNFDRLLEYEALLEGVFHEKPLRGICQYHRGTVPSKAIQDALLTHRSLYVGTTLNRDNLFYVPPELLLREREGRDKLGEWMCQQLMRIMDAERTRDRALEALRLSEAEQRRLAESLIDSNRDLEQRVQERTVALEAVNKELEAFSYSVSHDLRAPVRRIDAFTQVLEDRFAEGLGEAGLVYTRKVRDASGHMNELIDGMLSLGRVARMAMSPRLVDLTALADAAADSLRASDPARSVDFLIERSLGAVGDEALLRAVMENLLGNAWKFTSKRSCARIEVSAAEAVEGRRLFRVSDNGAGFDMAYADKLFGVFQRLHRQDEFPGTGVGLATVQRIIGRHGGKVWAEGSPDHGATFFFSLPVASSRVTLN